MNDGQLGPRLSVGQSAPTTSGVWLPEHRLALACSFAHE
jgi:hypothetical protein